MRYLNPKNIHSERLKRDNYKCIFKLHFSNFSFPITINEYNKIEKQTNINFYVFGHENNEICPLYISKRKFENHLKLPLSAENENQHYVLIYDFNRLMYNQTKHKEKNIFTCIVYNVLEPKHLR